MATVAPTLCAPMKEVCGEGFLECASSAQELVVLLLAFVFGWFLFRPLIGMLLPPSPVRLRASTKGPCPGGKDQSSTWPEPMNEEPQATAPTKEVLVKELDPPAPSSAPGYDEPSPSQGPDPARTLGGDGRPDLAAEDSWTESAGNQTLQRGADGQTSEGSVPGQHSHLALARWLARHQDVAGASNCIDSVRRSGGHIDLQTLRTLVVASARSGNMEKAVAYFRETVDVENLDPGFTTFSAMVQGLCATGQAEEAMTYLDSMLERGLRPDAALLDTVLESCASRNLLGLADKAMAIMQGLDFHPSNSTLAARIRLHSSRGELQRALQIFEEMPRDFGFSPNAYVHGVLISACFVHGRPEQALKAYASMISTGCFPNARTYECLVRSCLRLGRLEKAVSLVDEALCLKHPADASGSQEAEVQRTFIDTRTVEEVLTLVGRRREAKRLGLPLLRRLEATNFAVSENIAEALVRAAEAEAKACGWDRCRKRSELQRWRNLV